MTTSEQVRKAAEATLPEGEHLSFSRSGRGQRHVVHERDGGCRDCSGFGRFVTCGRHGSGCDCSGRTEECRTCGGTGKSYDADCVCPACVTVEGALEAEQRNHDGSEVTHDGE